MKYKLIALDIDGTLKSSEKHGKIILPKTKEILIKLAKQGVKIVLASGRPTAGLNAEAKELNFDETGGYLLAFNGAKITDYQTKEIIYQKTIAPATVHLIYDQAKKYNLAVMTYTREYIISEDIEDQYVQIESNITRVPLKPVANFKQTIDFAVNKVLLTGNPDYLAKIEADFKKPFNDTLSIYRSAPYFLEVMAQDIDKAASLKFLADTLEIKQEEIISFGDGYNDLSLIEFAGMGVAMDNAVAEVKQRADYITLSNDDEGIYDCLNKLVERGEI